MSVVRFTFSLSWAAPFCLPVVETQLELDDAEECPCLPPPTEKREEQ